MFSLNQTDGKSKTTLLLNNYKRKMGRFGRTRKTPPAETTFRPINAETDISVVVEPPDNDYYCNEKSDDDYDNEEENSTSTIDKSDDAAPSALYVPAKLQKVPSTLIWKPPVAFHEHYQKQQQKQQQQPTGTYSPTSISKHNNNHKFQEPYKNNQTTTFVMCDEDETTQRTLSSNEEELDMMKRSLYKEEQQNRRRERKAILICCVIFAMILGVVFGIVFHKLRKNNAEEQNAIAQDQDSLDSVAPTLTPITVDMISDNEDPQNQTVTDMINDGREDEDPPIQNKAVVAILNVLESHTDRNILLDSSTPQGQAFIKILEEVTSIDTINPVRVEQRYALMVTYYSTTGERWLLRDGWEIFDDDHCSWFGVTSCKQTEDGSFAITGLDLSHNNLAGSIPSEICILSSTIEQLHMGDNILLEGHIPQCISQFKHLIELTMDDCRLQGPLPQGLLTIPTLEVVHLYDNQLTGTMDTLFLENNNIMASNVFRIQRSQNLKEFKAYSNQLSGTIPNALSSFLWLESLWLNDNNLSGDVSSGVCDLRAMFLTELIMDCTSCEGNSACDCCTMCYCN